MKNFIIIGLVAYTSFLIGRGFEMALVNEGWY